VLPIAKARDWSETLTVESPVYARREVRVFAVKGSQSGRICAIKIFRSKRGVEKARDLARSAFETLELLARCARDGGYTISEPLAFDEEQCAVAMT
jgi:hypothetical protein